MTKKNDQDLTTELIQSGSDIAGAATGAAIGLIGGPLATVGGAVFGVALTRTLKSVGAELKRRVIAPGEGARVGATFAFAGELIAHSMAAGAKLREDGFFINEDGGRTPAEEILEGVLLKARDAYEEKKLQLLGVLYANIAFRAEITPSYANQLINLAGQLTYRQLVALSIAHEQGSRGAILQEINFRANEPAKQHLGLNGVSVLTEIYELYQRGLIHGASGEAWISLVDVNPGDMRSQGTGEVLVQIMGLSSISVDDRSEFYKLFPRV
jgi:hypothetical protein